MPVFEAAPRGEHQRMIGIRRFRRRFPRMKPDLGSVIAGAGMVELYAFARRHMGGKAFRETKSRFMPLVICLDDWPSQSTGPHILLVGRQVLLTSASLSPAMATTRPPWTPTWTWQPVPQKRHEALSQRTSCKPGEGDSTSTIGNAGLACERPENAATVASAMAEALRNCRLRDSDKEVGSLGVGGACAGCRVDSP